MDINAKIVKIFPQSKTVKAIASLTIDGCFAVHGVKIIDSEKGMFIAMPNEKQGNKYKDICHPLSSNMRRIIQDAVMYAYEQLTPANRTY